MLHAYSGIAAAPSYMSTNKNLILVHLFFIRTILKEHESHFCSEFKNKLRTIQPSWRTKTQIFN